MPASPNATSPLVSAPNDNLGVDDLRDLMRAVTQTTLRLEITHAALDQQVARLQHELAEANAALRRSQSLAALGEMAAGIAHEVRNPLASIQLYAQMLGEDLAGLPGQAELAAKITRAVVGLDAIVRDVLSFARDTTIHPETTDDVTLFERALAGCDSLIRGGKVRVTFSRDDECSCALHADAVLMTQALGNVIRNAIEAMVESGKDDRRLTLSSTHRTMRCPGGHSEPRIVIGVQDNGPGIPADVRDRIFNPFFTTRRTGTGLGLAIVHRIVDAHSGHVNIVDVSTGGTRVELCLPPAAPNVRNEFTTAIREFTEERVIDSSSATSVTSVARFETAANHNPLAPTRTRNRSTFHEQDPRRR